MLWVLNPDSLCGGSGNYRWGALCFPPKLFCLRISRLTVAGLLSSVKNNKWIPCMSISLFETAKTAQVWLSFLCSATNHFSLAGMAQEEVGSSWTSPFPPGMDEARMCWSPQNKSSFLWRRGPFLSGAISGFFFPPQFIVGATRLWINNLLNAAYLQCFVE